MKHVGTRTLGEKSFMYDIVRERECYDLELA
jgi:hypothetical protein